MWYFSINSILADWFQEILHFFSFDLFIFKFNVLNAFKTYKIWVLSLKISLKSIQLNYKCIIKKIILRSSELKRDFYFKKFNLFDGCLNKNKRFFFWFIPVIMLQKNNKTLFYNYLQMLKIRLYYISIIFFITKFSFLIIWNKYIQ